MDGECGDPDLEYEGRVDSDADRVDSFLDLERGLDCGVLDSESDESVTFDRERDDFCLGRGDGTGFGFDSESDASFDFDRECDDFCFDCESDMCLEFEGECDGFFSGRSDAADCGLGPESVALDLDWDCNDSLSERSGVTDFGLDSESDECMEDEEWHAFAFGRNFASDFDLDSESDACIDLDVQSDDLRFERSDASVLDVDSESVAWDLDWNCDDFFSRVSGRNEACDFERSSESDACLDLDGECSDLDRAAGVTDSIASLERVTE